MTIRICLLALIFLINACASLEWHNSSDASRQVLVINSDSSVARYDNAQKGFIESSQNLVVSSIDLSEDIEPLETVLDALGADDYKVVYAIGNKAASTIHYISPSIDVVYSSVLNWRRFDSNNNFYGIANELPPEVQLTWFKHIFSNMEDIALLYSQQNNGFAEKARDAAQRLGIKIFLARVDQSSDLEEQVHRLSKQTRNLWLISDAVVLPSKQGVNALFDLSRQYGMNVLGYDEFLIEQGALLVLESDRSTSGRQAAILAQALILDKKTSKHSLKRSEIISNRNYPAGSRIILNKGALDQSALKLNQNALDSISDIR